MTRWVLGIIGLFLAVLLIVATPPIRAATTNSPPSADCEEHPWDRLKNAYRVEIVIITNDYVVFAVWYTKEQAQPTLVRIDLRRESSSTSKKSQTRSMFIFTE